MIELSKGGLRMLICRPGTYYKGTRFDRSGVFRLVEKDGYAYADEWFDGSDEYVHDHVCGPSEEFLTEAFDGVAPGGIFVKPGVGLLRRPDEQPYDRFRLYEVVDEGRRTEEVAPESASFRQILPRQYDYTKTVRLLSDTSFEIAHRMLWLSDKPLHGYVYNHNFFTFGGTPVGPRRRLTLPYRPMGTWRAAYSSVKLDACGIAFSHIPELPSVFMGDLHCDGGVTPHSFRLSEDDRAVEVLGSEPLHHIVFWANRRVACPEPYMTLNLKIGECLEWKVFYGLV